MSTRANIILKEGKDKLYFYRHSDGYPTGTMPSLERFVNWMKEGRIRNNLSQGAGWLIVLGALEYSSLPNYKVETVNTYGRAKQEIIDESIEKPNDWKVGAYEPTTCIHGDIAYLYTIDMNKMTIEVKTAEYNNDYTKKTFRLLSEIELS